MDTAAVLGIDEAGPQSSPCVVRTLLVEENVDFDLKVEIVRRKEADAVLGETFIYVTEVL
jgi:hypothetical protein